MRSNMPVQDPSCMLGTSTRTLHSHEVTFWFVLWDVSLQKDIDLGSPSTHSLTRMAHVQAICQAQASIVYYVISTNQLYQPYQMNNKPLAIWEWAWTHLRVQTCRTTWAVTWLTVGVGCKWTSNCMWHSSGMQSNHVQDFGSSQMHAHISPGCTSQEAQPQNGWYQHAFVQDQDHLPGSLCWHSIAWAT